MPEPNCLFEVTLRCMQQRFLLRPSKRINELLVGALAKAKEYRPDVLVYVISALSNHLHLILSAPNVKELADFMNYFNSAVAREAGRLNHWHDKFWSDRYHATVIRGTTAMKERLAYVLAHGVKENLVARCADWPGVQSASALSSDSILRGIWIDRTGQYNACRYGYSPEQGEFEQDVQIKLERLPCYAHMSEREYQDEMKALIRGIESRAARRRMIAGKKVVGKKRVCRQNPHHKPTRQNRKPMPKCHADNEAMWLEYLLAYKEFESTYRRASTLWRAGVRSVEFPQCCFHPSGFVSEPQGPPPIPF